MKQELADELITTFPDLYKNLRDHEFEFGDGWFLLIKDLSSQLISTSFFQNSLKDGKSPPSIIIIKEKFGHLCIAFDKQIDKEILDLVQKFSILSEKTCEHCGQPGTIREPLSRRKRIKTLCVLCSTEYNQHQ